MVEIMHHVYVSAKQTSSDKQQNLVPLAAFMLIRMPRCILPCFICVYCVYCIM